MVWTEEPDRVQSMGSQRVGHDWVTNTFTFHFSSVYSVQFSRSVASDSLRLHEPQHARPPCPSPTPGVHPNPCPLNRWCHPTISSSVIPFSSNPQSFPASGSFPWAPTDLGSSSFSVLSFCVSYCSWGSRSKNTEVACHSLLQWTTFCQTFPSWPICLGWPHTAWLSFVSDTN